MEQGEGGKAVTAWTVTCIGVGSYTDLFTGSLSPYSLKHPRQPEPGT